MAQGRELGGRPSAGLAPYACRQGQGRPADALRDDVRYPRPRLRAIADCGRIASPFLPHVVLRASGGITGTLGVEAGSETARRGWRCVIDGTTLSVFRRKGTVFCVR